MESLHFRLALKTLEISLSYHKYKRLREWLSLDCLVEDREIYTPLIQEILVCFPKTSTSTLFYQIHHFAAGILCDLTQKEQIQMTEYLSKNQDMKERLTLAFDNSHTHRF